MEEKSELNDIILNKNNSSANSKRVVLAVATLGIVLILVVMLMNTLTSSNTDNLPQAVLPPEPQKETKAVAGEPLFEDVKVVQETTKENSSLDAIAQKLKEESIKQGNSTETAQTQQQLAAEQKKAAELKKVAPPKESVAQVKTPTPTPTTTPSGYYVQVGSFSKNQPNKQFLDSITKLGYGYTFHKVSDNATPLSKVLVGPFENETEARKALKNVRISVEPAAFLTKI
ncbi:MAG: SPOR domain-containing protein [Sulfurimonas sp.]|nr:SPOR domain-containing protein [Sulfurimonas sp.]